MKLLDLGEEMKEGGRVPNMADGGLVVLEERPSLLEAGLAGDRTGGIQNSPSVIQQAMDELNAKIGQSEYVQGVKQRMADPLGTIAGEAKRWSELPAEGMLGELGGHGLVGATKRVAESAYDPLFGYPSKAAFERYRKSEPREARLERLAEASKQRHPEALPASEALGKFEGKRLRLTQADRMIAAGEHQGGPRHSYLQQQSPEYKKRRSAWAVGNEQTANRMTKLNQSEPTVWTPYIGSEHQHASNLSAFNQLHKAFETAREEGKLPKELLNAYNQRLNVMSLKGQPLSVVKDSDKLMFPEGIDISKPGYRDLLNTYDKRREFANVIRGEGVGGKKAQIFDVDKMLHDLTEPSLRQVPQEHAGDTLFTLTGNVVHKPVMTKGAHPAYPYLLEGDDSGMIYRTTPAEVMVPEWTHGLEQKHGRGIQGIDYRTTDPNQFISEDYLNWLQRLGYKKGGQVKEPSIKEMKLSLMKSKTTGR
jgi:hypothetical protein